MKVVGFITEYNPFHFGHRLHLNKSIEKTGATHSVAIMSSSFVQRGEPSLIDKWSKAKMAIDNGVDLVLELPFIYSVQSAELFALGSVRMLNCLNIVNYITFGTEAGELKPLKNIALTLNKQPAYFCEKLREHLSKGQSFSASRSQALVDYYKKIDFIDEYDYPQILKKSNNILGIEYLKALDKLNSKIVPIALSREGNEYKDIDITTKLPSATGIRNRIQNHGLKSVEGLIPEETYSVLEDFYNEFNVFNYLDNYNYIFQYLFKILNTKDLLKVMDMEPGLENRILEKGNQSKEINEIIDMVLTKRYPSTRIKRILIHLLIGLNKNTIKEVYRENPPYIRVLASNKKGLEILNRIKAESELEIITKFADFKKLNDPLTKKMLELEIKATNIYYLGLNSSKYNMDFKTSPYISI